MRLDRRTAALVGVTLAGLVGGGIAALAGAGAIADLLWAATGVIAAIPLVVGFVESLRRREWGLDVIAILAIGGAVILEEYLAAAIVGLMLATGEALDSYAASRAESELTSLLGRAPREAHRLEDGRVVTVPIGDVRPGDRLLVKAGEVVPVDGVVVDGMAVLDESSLTGESSPVSHDEGDRIASGTVNGGDSFHLVASGTAEDSTYAGIVRLVEQAQRSKAPVSRLADRYALGFVPLALGLALLAWAASGDPVRALAVLVVATPCPLLLAVPIAIVSGVSQAAKRGVVVKGGGVLEQLADAEILVIDKTGTLTMGEAALTAVTPLESSMDPDQILGLAASLDQMSNHVLATALVRAARHRDLHLEIPTDVREVAGAGISGNVGDRSVSVGSADFVSGGAPLPSELRAYRRRSTREPGLNVYVAVDGSVVGAIHLVDEIRTDTPRTLRALRRLGIRNIVMATGDHPVVADAVGAAIGVDRVLAQCAPAEKVDAVRLLAADGVTVMVGDGINDAPALAAADVGVAMGARGATSSSEAADVVIIVDRLDRLTDAISIAQRSRRIATQSAFIGMGMSLAAMVVAALGYLPPVAGALVQEVIDVVAIVSALRVLGGGIIGRTSPKLPAELSARLKAEHLQLMPRLDEISRVADRLDRLDPEEAMSELRRVDRFVQDELIPHERADDREIYPILAGLLGGEDPMATMSLSHGEIFRLAGLLHRQVADVTTNGAESMDVFDLRRTMYGLHAVLQLHFAQEEELYESLDDEYHQRHDTTAVAITDA
ncbi:MAG: heavy metal translocating P-type ATPase [Acidimicrobiia bacterium]|jgi:heavy metal translocating P-type ATPase